LQLPSAGPISLAKVKKWHVTDLENAIMTPTWTGWCQKILKRRLYPHWYAVCSLVIVNKINELKKIADYDIHKS